MTGSYREFQRDCALAAVAWESCAETARLTGEFELARLCTERSARLRYLAEDDPGLRELFDGTGRWA